MLKSFKLNMQIHHSVLAMGCWRLPLRVCQLSAKWPFVSVKFLITSITKVILNVLSILSQRAKAVPVLHETKGQSVRFWRSIWKSGNVRGL